MPGSSFTTMRPAPRSTTLVVVEGHARRNGRKCGRRVRRPSRTRVRSAHAHRRSAGPHPAAPAGLERLLAAAHRAPASHASKPSSTTCSTTSPRMAPTAASTSSPASRSRCRSLSSANCSVCPSPIAPLSARPDRAARTDLYAGAVRRGQARIRHRRGAAGAARRATRAAHPGDDLVERLDRRS